MPRLRTTYDEEFARHERLIAALARRPAPRKLQRALEDVVDLWRPPDHWHSCMGGWVHWRVRPSAHGVAVVAAYHASERADVRRLVLGALRYARPYTPETAAAVAAGLVDEQVLVRIQAARAAADLKLGGTFLGILAGRLNDAVWTVRWNAALALGRTAMRTTALDALLASQPPPAKHGFHEWVGCALAFADLPAVRDRLASLGNPEALVAAREA
jgi:hypothetical protein